MKYVCLGIYTNLRGFGYACVEMPDKLLAHGVIAQRPYNQERIIYRIKKLLDFYAPNVVVLRDANSVDSIRMRKLINEITECAVEQNVPIQQYSRTQTKEVFSRFQATTKNEIADLLIKEWFAELSERRPEPRGMYEPEDYSMGIFDSLALIMTHEFLFKDTKSE